MGNHFSSKGEAFLANFASSYTLDKPVNDPRLGQVQVYANKSDQAQYVAIQQYSTTSQQISEQAFNAFSDFMNSNGNFIDTPHNDHPNLSKIYAVDIKNNNAALFHEYFHTNLRNQVELRMPNRFHFSSEEVWRTILSVIMAGYFLEQQGRYIGEISTRRIFLNKKGIVKVIPHLQSENDVDSFRRVAFYNQRACLSPECLQKIRESSKNSPYNVFKNDVFCLGLAILEMTSLEESLNLIDFETFTLNEDALAQRITKSSRYYGPYFKQFLEKMLVRQEQLRHSYSQLLQELLPYQQQIITGYQFYQIDRFRACPPSPPKQKSTTDLDVSCITTKSTHQQSKLDPPSQSSFSINMSPCPQQTQTSPRDQQYLNQSAAATKKPTRSMSQISSVQFSQNDPPAQTTISTTINTTYLVETQTNAFVPAYVVTSSPARSLVEIPMIVATNPQTPLKSAIPPTAASSENPFNKSFNKPTNKENPSQETSDPNVILPVVRNTRTLSNYSSISIPNTSSIDFQSLNNNPSRSKSPISKPPQSQNPFIIPAQPVQEQRSIPVLPQSSTMQYMPPQQQFFNHHPHPVVFMQQQPQQLYQQPQPMIFRNNQPVFMHNIPSSVQYSSVNIPRTSTNFIPMSNFQPSIIQSNQPQRHQRHASSIHQ